MSWVPQIIGAVEAFLSWLTGERDPDKIRERKIIELKKLIQKETEERNEIIKKQLHDPENENLQNKHGLITDRIHRLRIEIDRLRAER